MNCWKTGSQFVTSSKISCATEAAKFELFRNDSVRFTEEKKHKLQKHPAKNKQFAKCSDTLLIAHKAGSWSSKLLKCKRKPLKRLLYPFISNKSCQSTSFCLDPRNLSAPSIHFDHFFWDLDHHGLVGSVGSNLMDLYSQLLQTCNCEGCEGCECQIGARQTVLRTSKSFAKGHTSLKAKHTKAQRIHWMPLLNRKSHNSWVEQAVADPGAFSNWIPVRHRI